MAFLLVPCPTVYAFVSCVLIFNALPLRSRSLGESWHFCSCCYTFFPLILFLHSQHFVRLLAHCDVCISILCTHLAFIFIFRLCVSHFCVYRCFANIFVVECSSFVWMDFIWICLKCFGLWIHAGELDKNLGRKRKRWWAVSFIRPFACRAQLCQLPLVHVILTVVCQCAHKSMALVKYHLSV